MLWGAEVLIVCSELVLRDPMSTGDVYFRSKGLLKEVLTSGQRRREALG